MNKNQNKRKNKVSIVEVIRYTLEQIRSKASNGSIFNKLAINKLWRYRLTQYGLLMRLDKPIGTLLLLWPTLWALWLASEGNPSVSHILIFTCGVFLMRSVSRASEMGLVW